MDETISLVSVSVPCSHGVITAQISLVLSNQNPYDITLRIDWVALRQEAVGRGPRFLCAGYSRVSTHTLDGSWYTKCICIIFVSDRISQVVMITLPWVHPLCLLVFPLVCIVRSLNVIKWNMYLDKFEWWICKSCELPISLPFWCCNG